MATIGYRRFSVDEYSRIADRYGTPVFLALPHVFASAAGILTGSRNSRLKWAYPIKTLPLPAFLERWRSFGQYVEASSEAELFLAHTLEFDASRIIVSGVGKIEWLRRCSYRRMTVILDSLAEVDALVGPAVANEWRIGLRLAPTTQRDPDAPYRDDQFGLSRKEFRHAVERIATLGGELQLLHFHMGGWQGALSVRSRALRELRDAIDGLPVSPRVIDIGGGLAQTPSTGSYRRYVTSARQTVRALAKQAGHLFPQCTSIIAECGRALLAGCAELLLTIQDVKRKNRSIFLICDGGRINQALPSDWEYHLLRFPMSRTRSTMRATICGPNCMAWDWLSRGAIPVDVRTGDLVVYEAAGAYHLPWESRFSQLICPIVETQIRSGRLVTRLLRPRQDLRSWSSSWGRA